jgi:hypothetical protein
LLGLESKQARETSERPPTAAPGLGAGSVPSQ